MMKSLTTVALIALIAGATPSLAQDESTIDKGMSKPATSDPAPSGPLPGTDGVDAGAEADIDAEAGASTGAGSGDAGVGADVDADADATLGLEPSDPDSDDPADENDASGNIEE